jgi:hypothetical protein
MAGKDREINMHEIYTIPNNGYSQDRVTHNNACMWISIRDYLLHFTGKELTVSQLKRIARLPPHHHENYEFDFETHGHNLEILANKLGLCVKVYPVQNGALDKSRVFTFGKCNGEDNIADIISYGAHFELMVLDKNFVDRGILVKNFKKYIPKIIGFDGKYEKDIRLEKSHKPFTAVPRFTKSSREPIEEQLDIQRAIEESLRQKKPIEESFRRKKPIVDEQLHMQRAIEESHSSVNAQFLKLSHELTELTNKINNQRFNINGFERAIRSGELNDQDTHEYITILENSNKELKHLQREKKEIETAMDELHQYVQFGGNIYIKQKYLKYKNKYNQLKKHIRDQVLRVDRKK